MMLCEFYSSALEFQENLLVKYYRKHGHEVVVIASTHENIFDYYGDRHDNRTPASISYDHGAKIVKLPYRFNILNRVRAYTSITPILDQEKPDLIYVHDIMLNLPECVAYMRTHPECRMIMDYHADYSNSGKNKVSLLILHGIIRKWFLDQALPYLSRIFPVVPAGIVFLNEVYKVPKDLMEVLPLGADTDLVRSVKKVADRRLLREANGFDDSDIVIFTGGKIEPKKRLEVLFSAVKTITSVSIKVLVAGEAGAAHKDYERILRNEARGMPNISLMGWLGREDMYKAMVMADMAVFPASQSIVWQQAIAAGLPLICGDSGHQDVSYLNQGNIVMLQAQHINARDLAAAIEDVAKNPKKREHMRVAAEQVAAEQLDWNRLIERTLRFNQARPVLQN